MASRSKRRAVTARTERPDLRVVSSPSITEPAPQGDVFKWDEAERIADTYAAMGKRLKSGGALFRSPIYGGGLVHVFPDKKHDFITKGPPLSALITDRVHVQVVKDGTVKGGRIAAGHLSDMLLTESFLGEFEPVDLVSHEPLYLPDWTLTKPGYNDGGPGHRIYYTGGKAEVSDSLETIKAFLDVMEFEDNADKTNAVGAALTVMHRNHRPGGKPIIVATAPKSHAGKDTIISFATGTAKSVAISYQSKGWPVERNFVGAIKSVPEAALLAVENARLDGGAFIASAFLERFCTDPEPFLFSTGTGAPVRIRNNIVLAISTNFGTLSEDLMNRSLPIRLHPVGDVADRKPKIGNPRFEFLPANNERIAAELRGMVERWTLAGKRLDEDVRHPFTLWARTVGGILRANGFTNFLGNYSMRRTADDPLRHGLALLGGHHPDKWLRAADWAKFAVDLGLTKAVIPESDRENDVSCARGIGAVLSAHERETFTTETDTEKLTLKLERVRKRDHGEPHLHYQFRVIHREELM